MATTVVTAPTIRTMTIQETLLGSQSLSSAMGKLKGMPTAVAETAIMEPARKQNIRALTRLYKVVRLLPQIFSSL